MSRAIRVQRRGRGRRLLDLRKELIDPSITASRGRIVKTTGKRHSDRILQCGSMRCEVQRGMVVRNAEFMPQKRIEFSAGIHLGMSSFQSTAI
jgi:class 3 adenylate cyclase